MTTDNRYYKAIAEKLTGETISGVHTNNYYLNKICTSLGYTYSGVTCNGTYIKDFARHFTEQTYTKIHFNNYYLKKLAENLTGETYSNHDDNYFLGIINDNIIAPTPTFTSVAITSDKSILSYADSESAVLTAQLMNGDVSASVSGETVDFYKYVDGTNDVLLGSDVTDSNGKASYSYASTGVGDVGLYAKVRSLVTETFSLQDCYRYDNATSDKSSNYTKTSNLNVSHSTDHYILTASSNNSMMCIGSGYDNVRYEFLMSGTSHFARGLYCSDTQNYYETNSIYNIYQTNNNNKRIQMADITGGSWSAIKETRYTFTNNTYYRFIIEINGTSITLKVETEDGTVIESQTVTKSMNAHYVGTLMYSGTAYVKDIKVKAL